MAVAKTYADEIGLSVDWSDLAATRSKRAWITQMPEAFDFESPLVPREFHHTGPFIDGVGRPRIDFPWEKLTGDSLVYASMGTLQNGSQAVFRTISEVANERKQLQFVVAAGKNVDLTPLLPGPPNVIFVEHAPQLELLKKAALCITHGGLNTVLESLSEGVPLLALPVTNDQPGVAARIEEHKVGEFLPLPRLSTERLGELVDCVLTNPEYQQNASRMKNAIIRTDGLSLAATTIANALQSPSYKG